MTAPPDHHRVDRRRALTTLGTISLGTLVAACSSSSTSSSATSTPPTSTAPTDAAPGTSLFADAASCTLSPEQTEGPYYFDVDSIRSDIREDRQGVPLRLAIRVLDASTCSPLSNAVVDIWHCDAIGTYSGFEATSTGAPGGGRSDDETYLRGAQVTNGDGVTEFITVYPGWYQGRTVHIHAKLHLDNNTLLTTQLYFPESVNDAVYLRDPYASDSGRDTTNDDDAIFDEQMVMSVNPDGDGYLAVMTVNVRT
jgi:protocatechuate 3,4-dioxygenase beta subunit